MQRSNFHSEVIVRRNVRRNTAGIVISFISCAILSYMFPVPVVSGSEHKAKTAVAAPAQQCSKKVSDVTIDYGNNADELTGDVGVNNEAEGVQSSGATVYGSGKTGRLKIEVGSDMGNASVTVINVATGQVVKERGGLKGSVLDLDVSDLSRGDYLVAVEDGLHRCTCRFSRS